MSIWDEKDYLAKMEIQRARLKEDGKRLTFDCMNLHCQGDRAYCSKGMRLGQSRDGSLALVMILRGTTAGACLYCGEFTMEEV